MANKTVCADCGMKRDRYRPVARLVDGVVAWVCRHCWRDKTYSGDGLPMYDPPAPEDQALMRKFRC